MTGYPQSYILLPGRKYKNHAATIRRWAADISKLNCPEKGHADYSYKEEKGDL